MAFHFSAMQVSEGERKRWHLLPNANLIVLWMLFGVCLSALPTAVNRQRPNCSNVSVVSISVIERGSGKIISNMASSIIGLDFNILWLNNSPKNFCSFCAKFATPTRTTTTTKTERVKSLATLAQLIPNMAPIGASNKPAQQTVKIPTGRNPNEYSHCVPLACLFSWRCLRLSCGAGDRRQKGVVLVKNFCLGITIYKDGSLVCLKVYSDRVCNLKN